MIYQCADCGSQNLETIDADTGEFLPNWLVDARGIGGWDIDCEPALFRWQDVDGYTDEEMQNSVEALINSERLSGKKPVGYASLSMALQRRVRMKWDAPGQHSNERYTKRVSKY